MSVCSSDSLPVALLTGFPQGHFATFGELGLGPDPACSSFGGDGGGPPVPSHATATTPDTPNTNKTTSTPTSHTLKRPPSPCSTSRKPHQAALPSPANRALER